MTKDIEIDKQKAIAEVKDWINHILLRKGWNGTELANKAGVAPSTVLRMFSAKNYTFISTYATIRKIAMGSGFKPPPSLLQAFGVSDVGFDTGMDMQGFDTRSTKASSPLLEQVVELSLDNEKEGFEVDAPAKGKHLAANLMPRRYMSTLPKQFHPPSKIADVMIPRPARFDGDGTAFALSMNDADFKSALIPLGSQVYATKARDPVRNDLVLVTKADGRSVVRLLLDINDAGVSLANGSGDEIEGLIAFSAIEDISVIVMIERP